MIVYMVYEGPDLFGIFSTRKKAEQYVVDYNNKPHNPQNFKFDIVSYRIDEEPYDFL